VEVVGGAKVEGLRRLVVLEDGTSVGPGQLVSPGHDRLQHRVELQRGAQGTAHVRQGSQLVHRAREVSGSRPQFTEKPCVLDGNHGLVGKGLEQLDLDWRKWTSFSACDGDGSDRLPVTQQWRGEYGSPSAGTGQVSQPLVQGGIRFGVRNVDEGP